ncbi:histidine kinase [uncultured Aquimarina sp.]|uniref:tetratricopeptide repeat-containing sensor histidine kinase n=1 Tax=uncultured Aquimarina sp. TaxID=575652 RepID=UPI00261EA6C4|nr:histidine kinase [uncultured Aquimarina sp.]
MRTTLLLVIIMFGLKGNSQKKSYTQKEIDTFKIYPTNRENLLKYQKMLETDENLLGWTYYYSKKSVLYLGEDKLDSCYFFANKAISSYDTSDKKRKEDETQLARAYYNGGRALRLHYKDHNKALDYMMNALRVINKYPGFSKYLKGYILRDISSNHLEMGDNSLALMYLLKTSKDTNYLKNPLNYGPLYNSIGNMYFDLKKIDSAKFFYKKALLDTIIGIKVTSHNHLGNLFHSINQKDSAFYHFKNSKDIVDLNSEKVSDYSRYSSHINYGQMLLNKGEYSAAIYLLNKTLDSINALDKLDKRDRDLKVRNMDYLIKTYQKNGKLEDALSVSRKKSDFLQKFHQQVLDEKLRELNIAYEVKEKEESIEQLAAITEEQQIIIKQRNIISIALLGILVSIIGVGILLFRQRKLKSKYETANLKQRLLRSQLNPHFVFNALNTVSNLVNKKSGHTLQYISKLSSLIRLILKNSREEFIVLEDELQSVEDYLELESNFSQQFTYSVSVSEDVDIEETFIPPMFIQPFIENSIQHGLRGVDDGFIKIVLSKNEKEGLIQCLIVDNGTGITKSSEFKSKVDLKHQSFSGKIIKERLQIYAKSLNKKTNFTIDQIPDGKGTEVKVMLPYLIDA